MALGKRQTDTPVPPELQPYYDGNSGAGWLRWVIRGAIALVIVVLIILGIIWLTHRHSTSAPQTGNKTDGSSQTQTKQPSSSSNSKSDTKTPSDSPDNSSEAPASTNSDNQSSSSSNSSATTTPAGAIPNTGPGDTLGLFAIASVVGIVFYQLRLRSKLSQ